MVLDSRMVPKPVIAVVVAKPLRESVAVAAELLLIIVAAVAVGLVGLAAVAEPLFELVAAVAKLLLNFAVVETLFNASILCKILFAVVSSFSARSHLITASA